MADAYDVIVIGGGPGGYVAAIRAAQLGQKTAVVERDKPGGRCLNYACIPAKTMLHTAELYDHALNGAELGIKVEGASLDWKALGARRAKVSETLAGGVKMLWDKNKVELIEGEGSLTGDGNVEGRRRDLRGGRGGPRHRLGRDADPGRGVRRARGRHLGRLVASRATEEDRRGRGGRIRRRDRLRLWPLRHRGGPDRDARPDPPRRGQGHGEGGRAGLQEAEHHDLDRHQGGGGRGRQGLGQGQVRGHRGRGRLPLHRRRPGARHRGAEPRRGRGRDRGERKDQGRRLPADVEPEGLRDRRPGRGEGARAQGVRGGRRGR